MAMSRGTGKTVAVASGTPTATSSIFHSWRILMTHHEPDAEAVAAATPDYRRRDALSLTMIGTFFVLIAALVLAGQFFGESTSAARIVNLVAGATLLLASLGMLAMAARMRFAGRESRTGDTSPGEARK